MLSSQVSIYLDGKLFSNRTADEKNSTSKHVHSYLCELCMQLH